MGSEVQQFGRASTLSLKKEEGQSDALLSLGPGLGLSCLGESSSSLAASANVFSGRSISSEGIHKSISHTFWSLLSHSGSRLFMPLLPLN